MTEEIYEKQEISRIRLQFMEFLWKYTKIKILIEKRKIVESSGILKNVDNTEHI